MLDGPGRSLGPRAPLVGRESELELLENTFNRSVRDRRAHLFTIYGSPGSGRAASHASSSTASSVRVLRAARCRTGRRHVLAACGDGQGRCGYLGRRPARGGVREASRVLCGGGRRRRPRAGRGLMEALEGERSSQEIAWAASEVMHGIADVQPLLLFEDIHWAEALLDLIEHLADVRAPLLIVCLARPELLEARPGWGGGRVRSTAIELERCRRKRASCSSRSCSHSSPARRERCPPRSRARCSSAPKATRCSSRRRSA